MNKYLLLFIIFQNTLPHVFAQETSDYQKTKVNNQQTSLQTYPLDSLQSSKQSSNSPKKDELDDLWNTPANSKNNPFKGFNNKKVNEYAKPKNPFIVLRLLDKTIAKFYDVKIPIGQYFNFGTINIYAQTCLKRPADEFPEISGLLVIKKRNIQTTNKQKFKPKSKLKRQASKNTLTKGKTQQGKTQQDKTQQDKNQLSYIPVSYEASLQKTNAENRNSKIMFNGWMFALNPSLNSLQHPIYDVWIIDCNIIVPS